MQKKLFVTMLLIIFILTAVGCSKIDNKEYVAKVNGEVIYQDELDKRVAQAAVMYSINLEDPQFAAYKDVLQLQMLEGLIEEILVINEAKNRKLEVKKEDLDGEVASFKEQFSSEKEYNEILEQMKLTEEDLRKSLETKLLYLALFEDVTKDINTTDVDVKEYYEKNKEEFYQEEQIKATHILVKTEEEAKEIIKKIVEEGEDMGQLAYLKSIDPTAKNNYGDLGYFGKGRMVKPFEEAAFALKVGEITKTPVQTTYGYHVIRVEDKLEAKQLAFTEVKEELEERFINQAKNEKFTNFLDKLKEKAKIENKLEEKIKAEKEKAEKEQEKAEEKNDKNEGK